LQSRDLLDALLKQTKDYVDRKTRTVLVVEPDKELRTFFAERFDSDAVEVVSVQDLSMAAKFLREQPIDCLVVDTDTHVSTEELDSLSPSDEDTNDGPTIRIPLILHSTHGQQVEPPCWKRLHESFTIRQTDTSDHLLDAVVRSIHHNVTRLAEWQQQVLQEMHHSDLILDGKKVLIVDDDMRNIFALSTVLEEHNMVISSADNGRDAIKLLEGDSEIDIVLMDIMMPEMDGMETMRTIRKIGKLKNLPIVAVTAKAMKGDREKCIEAGAWDYLSKPVDPERMLSVLRAWLQQSSSVRI
jgi:CheY-like chemotaxis protein